MRKFSPNLRKKEWSEKQESVKEARKCFSCGTGGTPLPLKDLLAAEGDMFRERVARIDYEHKTGLERFKRRRTSTRRRRVPRRLYAADAR